MSKAKDSKYFNPTKKGEIHELKQELDSGKDELKRECLKKIIAAMTIGKDVSMLFPDVVKQIQTTDLELKKLVYLYVMNYAKTQPDLAILSVNAFVQDSTKNRNPLIRALAIRTMGCIRVEKITEYLCQPLQQCLKDPDPYVRKTAAVCVAKLYDISPELVENQGFLDMLTDLLSDSNPMVVANAVAALSEISETAQHPFSITSNNLNKLLAALNECTEWGQIFILSALAGYDPRESREAESIAERVTARLQHNNAAVVLGAVRVLMKYIEFIQSPEVVRGLTRKMAAPLVTLLAKAPEISYVALRNIDLILQKRPNVLQHELKVFFCKYNDPIYVKMEKLQILIKLVSERNVDQVLLEFKEYATAADVEFVRKSVRAIGRTAIKLEKAAERCIHVLLELIENGFNPVVQEAIIVIKDIFRKYPNQYESIIGKLCENLDSLDEPEARAAMIWIIGEYAERIDNADELLDQFLEAFLDEPTLVQLQLLTATVKLFLKRPKNSKDMVLRVLNLATQECGNPDIRDRGFVYWRLLTNPKAAKAVVLAEKPLIETKSTDFAPEVLDALISNLSTLAAVYHKPPETFVPKLRRGKAAKEAQRLKKLKRANRIAAQEGDQPTSSSSSSQEAPAQQQDAAPPSNAGQDLLSLDLDGPAVEEQEMPQPEQSTLDLLTSLDTPAAPAADASAFFNAPVVNQAVLLPADRGNGLQVRGAFARVEGSFVLELTLENHAQVALSGFAIQFNKNVWGIAPSTPLTVAEPIHPGTTATAALQLGFAGQKPPAGTAPSLDVQVALKDNRQVHYFQITLEFELLVGNDGKIEQNQFLQLWGQATQEVSTTISGVANEDVNIVCQKFSRYNIFTVAQRQVQNKNVAYYSLKIASHIPVLMELAFVPGTGACACCVKTPLREVIPFFGQFITKLLTT